jgi:hypothetical protein
MKPSPLVVQAVARTLLLAMTAFTLVVAVRVLGEPHRSAMARSVEPVAEEQLEEGDLPPGHPDVDGCPRLPPGHPPVGRERLPAGHPPVDGGARAFPLFPQDGTSTL